MNPSPRKQSWQETGVMNLFKLADSGTYYVYVKINKKSYRESQGTTNQKVAMRRLRDWLIEHSLSKPLSGSPNSLASLVEEYLARLASEPNVAPHESVRLPAHSPNLNAIAERFVRSIIRNRVGTGWF